MSDTIRQKICANLIGRLKAIAKNKGYCANYPVIQEWKLGASLPDELPAIELRDDSCDVVTYDEANTAWLLNLTVIITAKGEESQEDLRNYINDIYKCFGADVLCGGYGRIKPEGDAMILEQHEDVYGDIEVKFTVSFETESWDLTRQM